MPKPQAAFISLALAFSLATPGVLRAADIRVDQLELLTHGALNQSTGTFDANSWLNFNLVMEGGDKFSGLLKLNLINSDVENALNLSSSSLNTNTATTSEVANNVNNSLSPQLMTVAMTAKSVFSLPLDLSFFVGQMDNFCSGEDFVPLFGAAPFSTDLRGPMVYPNGVGGNPRVWFDGIHQADGTGFRLSTTPNLSSSSVGYAYFYQDSNVGQGTWSGDLRYLVNSPSAKAEIFTGATTGGSGGLYRGGLLFYATSGGVGEFFSQVGITHWDPTQTPSIDDFFFLFEPRLNFGHSAQAVITVFSHPSWYLQKDYSQLGEEGALDASFDLRFGRIEEKGSRGGVETLLAFRPQTIDPTVTPVLAVDTSPYYSIISGGIRWDFKLDLRVFPFPSPWYGMFMPYIGFETSY
jgi:hypothetical protein